MDVQASLERVREMSRELETKRNALRVTMDSAERACARVVRILEAHDVGYVFEGERVIAEELFDVGPSDWVDVTDWNPAMLREWLGY